MEKTIAVIGSGVIGLTSAIRLLEAGHAVTVYAQAIPPHTTSDIAAAYWAPGAAMGGGRMRSWALGSLAVFQELASDPASGVTLRNLYELADEPLSGIHPGLPVPAEIVPPGVFPAPWSGVRVTVPQIDVPIYMPWLKDRFLALGGQVIQTEIHSFAELIDKHSVIVNCAGLGAQTLTGDAMYPIRGQVIRVRKPPGLAPDMIYAESAGEVTYIIRRSGDCLLGGTYHYGDSRTQVDREIAAGIIARCAQFNPSFKDPYIIEHRVGLRPGMHHVRLEVEQFGNGALVIHNYGHSAVGHTLSWGCAAEVARLVARL
jgi:D-amino-acid oxidase